MTLSLLPWFDAHPNAYWGPAAVMLLALMAWVARDAWQEAGRPADAGAAGTPRRWDEAVFGLLVLATLLAWRWPQLIFSYEFSPDESQQVAGALTLARHPLFWNAVDGATAGPLNFYALLPLHWLGLPVGFLAARLTLMVMLTGIVLALCRAVEPWCGAALARLGCLPAILFFIFATLYDFAGYSTEYPAMLLLAVGAALTAQLHARRPPTAPAPRSLWLLGLVLGAVPWAKLQAVPLAACVGAVAVAAILRAAGPTSRQRLRLGLHFAAACVLPTLVALALIAAMGQWLHFYNSYIAYNRLYVARGGPGVATLRTMWKNSQLDSFLFPAFAVTTSVVGLVATFAALFVHRRLAGLLAAAALAAAGVAVIAAPGRDFPHYLLFLVVPLTLWCALGIGFLWEGASHRPATQRRAFVALAFTLLAAPVFVARLSRPPPFPWGGLAVLCCRPASPISQAVLAASRPGDDLAIWGWFPQGYVETGLPQAVRDAHSQRQIEESPLRDYYRGRYLDDLLRNRPAVFVDAVGPGRYGFQDRQRFGHETFAALARFVQDNYVLNAEIDGARVYSRRDRAGTSPRPPGGR